MYCQECKTPLKLDGSLQDLSPAAFKLLTDSAGSPKSQVPSLNPQSRQPFSSERREDYASLSKNARSPTFKRTVASSRHVAGSAVKEKGVGPKQAPDMSFIMLTDSQIMPEELPVRPSKPPPPPLNRRRSMAKPNSLIGEDDSFSNQMETAGQLFEILSSHSDIDHPICVECTERLVDQLQKRLGNAARERDAYVGFLRQANSDIPTEEELEQARSELRKLQNQEAAAMTNLEKLEAQKAAMEDEILDLDAQSHELDLDEDQFWAERNSFSQKLTGFQSERDRINNQYDHDSKQLERLRRANVYNDTFSIGHDGYFGTINGLRLGRLPEKPVEWSEINAAWGHTCLLLATVAEKLSYTFKGYELVPMGSSSKIRQNKTPRNSGNDPSHPVKQKWDTYKLSSSGEAIFNVGIFHRDFDSAMVAFLECLRQLIQHAERTPIRLPDGTSVECPRIGYKIEKDKIGDNSIKLSGLGNQEESWTKACKLTLICCKFLLAHASNVNEIRRRG
ncbi:APG6-domain-containing protein [Venturia nashicola]|uniref:APG6-domain-containing protein n=1 Tax=Venturia nashicola TaxID=86259 RepID=A0A4Z1NQD3_9PEZI|nr:APG6-domain-containing protein [Venturia nashicola]TLD25791.1 APG6-domain-containing protein [Venturia nashicola]